VLEAIAAGRNRILLTLATGTGTGTGKTSIAFQIIWKLFQARWNLSGQPSRRPRILFLADRNNLADQALNDFTAFASSEENALARIEPAELLKKGRVPTNASGVPPISWTYLRHAVADLIHHSAPTRPGRSRSGAVGGPWRSPPPCPQPPGDELTAPPNRATNGDKRFR